MKTTQGPNEDQNILNFPPSGSPTQAAPPESNEIPTPKSDKIFAQVEKLRSLSKYEPQFDFDTYRKLEKRFGHNQPRGGIIFNTPFRLVNSHHTCQQCLYAFEVDTYGRGCVHNCVYCYAKAELTVHGYWNKPFPMPIDISEIWKTFYTVFETDKKSKWRSIMEKKVPLRIGSMSDSFMFLDKKYGVTKELLRILDYYQYPYIIFTHSDLVAHDEYLDLLNPDLCSIQMSISSTNDDMNKLIEPGAPSAKRRLKALEKLVKNGFWTTARLNPFFPIYPDGYFTNPDFDRTNMPEPFHYSSFEMVDEIASYGVQSILAGMVRLSSFSISQIEKAVGRDLKPLFDHNTKKDSLFVEKTNRKSRDFHYSREEVRAYYERLQAKCLQNSVQFTTCYIGNGEDHFWKDQDLWSNKKDCCNAKGRVKGFSTKDSRSIDWYTRMKHTSQKFLTPNNPDDLHAPMGPAIIIDKEGPKVNQDMLDG